MPCFKNSNSCNVLECHICFKVCKSDWGLTQHYNACHSPISALSGYTSNTEISLPDPHLVVSIMPDIVTISPATETFFHPLVHPMTTKAFAMIPGNHLSNQIFKTIISINAQILWRSKTIALIMMICVVLNLQIVRLKTQHLSILTAKS